MPTIAEKAETFRKLHESGTFLMPNAWNGGSAVMLSAGNFPAIATTSAGIAFSAGCPDGEGDIERDEMMAACAEIAGATDLPVSGDTESGYGPRPEDMAETVRASIAAGMVGGSHEDYRDGAFMEPEEAADRVRAGREAADASGIAFTLTARAECFLYGHDDAFAESVRRLNLYREAGADCLYAPGITDADVIRDLVQAVDGPVNVVMGLAGKPFTVAQLADLGVRRISIGGSLARATFGVIRRAVEEMSGDGTFGYAASQVPDAELTELFKKANIRG